MTRKRYDSGAFARGEELYYAIDPDADDATIAEAVAEVLVVRDPPPYCFSIFHDVRPSTPRKVEKMQRMNPAYRWDQPFGPCPLRYDWHRKNIVGIKTADREAAKAWARQALLLGYAVFYQHSIRSWGAGKGTLADVREQLREQRELRERVRARVRKAEEVADVSAE